MEVQSDWPVKCRLGPLHGGHLRNSQLVTDNISLIIEIECLENNFNAQFILYKQNKKQKKQRKQSRPPVL